MKQVVQRRQLWNLVLIVTFIIAISLAAVVFIGADDPFASPGEDDPDTATDAFPAVDEYSTVGGGSIGGAAVNPVGEAINEDVTNPLATTNATKQFTVETAQPQYWRVNAYDRYEDGEWLRTEPTVAYTDRLPETGPTTGTADHTVTLQRDTTMLPAAWQPAEIDFDGEGMIGVSGEHGIDLETKQSAETEYTVETYTYDPDPAALSTPSGDPPQTIVQQYGSEKGAIPDEIEDVGEAVTEDTATAADAACAVQDWLQANYDYNRTATPAGDDPVTEFLFDTETGNAEYFASSMTTVLQSQDIPARYVTGYGPGEAQEDTEGSYNIYSANTHAWTEVYVAGHGWIPFDPTPTDDRLAAAQTHIEPDGELVNHTVAEVCDADTDPALPPADEIGDEDEDENGAENGNESDNGDEPTNGDDPVVIDPDPGADTDYTLLLSDESPLPGGQITVTVQQEESPVAGINVFVNGEDVGSTDENGEITITVPYASNLVITLETAETATVTTNTAATTTGTTDHTYTVPITGSLSVTTNPAPLIADGTATTYVTIGGNPVTNAAVAVNGDHIGTTDETGSMTMDVPAKDEIAITVERGELTTTASHAVVPLELSTETDRVLAMPGQNVSVTLTAGGQPVAGAQITTGETTVTTDTDGTTAVPISALQTTITGEHADAETTHEVQNLLLPGIGGGVAGVVLVVGGVIGMRRYTGVTERATTVTRTLTQRLLQALSRIETGIQAISTRANEGTGAIGQYPLAQIKRGIRWAKSVSVTGGLSMIVREIWAGLIVPVRWINTRFRETDEPTTDTADGEQTAQTEVQQSIRDIWGRFTMLVTPQEGTTATPAEIAQQAVTMGLPKRPVTRLLDIFRKAEYGPPEQHSEQLANDAADAFAELEDEQQTGEDET